jgi:hypothetical protein
MLFASSQALKLTQYDVEDDNKLALPVLVDKNDVELDKIIQ